MKIAINELECAALVIAVKLWASKFKGCNLLLHCDNSSTVAIVNKGYARNKFTQMCLRELAWCSAKNDIWLKVSYLPGVLNRFSDLLSRWSLGQSYQDTFWRETQGLRKKEFLVTEESFDFVDKWKY